MASGEEPGSRGGADVCANVSIGAANSGRGELVENRSFDLQRPIAAKVTVPHVIRQDHQDIGLIGFEREDPKKNENKEAHAER
jgi:hypothetical protein